MPRRAVTLRLRDCCPRGHANVERIQPWVRMRFRDADPTLPVRERKCPVCERVYWVRARAYQKAAPPVEAQAQAA